MPPASCRQPACNETPLAGSRRGRGFSALATAFALLGGVFAALSSPGPASSASPSAESEDDRPFAHCLPADIKLSDVAEAHPADASGKAQVVTVREKLDALRATCGAENKLVDENGRPIVFYRLIGCWGRPPPDYLEQLQKQRAALEQLRQRNTVIEMTCNPSGARIS